MSGRLNGLSRYGIHKRTVVRVVAVDDGITICPECGRVIEGTRGTQYISGSQVVDKDAVGVDNRIPTLGYECKGHSYPVVVPVPYAHISTKPGWSPVPVDFADGETRAVGVPTRELPGDSE